MRRPRKGFGEERPAVRTAGRRGSRGRRGVRALPVVVLALWACGGGEPPPEPGTGTDAQPILGDPSGTPPPPPAGTDAAELLGLLEEGLLEETGVRIPFRIVAEGALAADLSGTLLLAGGNRLRLDCTGTFGADRVEALLLSDGERMVRTVGGSTEETSVPPDLREGIVLGLTRMGLLHNLARLVAGAFPDATDGTAPEWVQPVDPAHGSADPQVPTAVSVAFGIRVAGQPAGEATLWLDPVTDVPLLRRQVVRFPGGEMRVTERYEEPVADLEVADSLFVLPPPAS